jgi:S1-C subfamily serine protease
MNPTRLVLTAPILLALGCATAAPEMAEPAPVGPEPAPLVAAPPPAPAAPASPASPAAPPPAPTCTMFVKPGVVGRAALVRLVDAGMPRWLQGVEGDRVLAKHRFQGWVIKSLHRADPCYQDIDLRQGDVVQKVNGKSIEKPEQAFEVFESVRTAPAIVVDYLRAGKPRQLTLPISDEK